MVGNDELEDMYAASSAGLQCYHVTDCKIASDAHPWQGESGSFVQLVQMMQNLS